MKNRRSLVKKLDVFESMRENRESVRSALAPLSGVYTWSNEAPSYMEKLDIIPIKPDMYLKLLRLHVFEDFKAAVEAPGQIVPGLDSAAEVSKGMLDSTLFRLTIFRI